MSCNACMSLSLFKVHNCREKAMEQNCPVCSEFLFDSADSIKVCVGFACLCMCLCMCLCGCLCRWVWVWVWV